jgi:hypothetical protein
MSVFKGRLTLPFFRYLGAFIFQTGYYSFKACSDSALNYSPCKEMPPSDLSLVLVAGSQPKVREVSP